MKVIASLKLVDFSIELETHYVFEVLDTRRQFFAVSILENVCVYLCSFVLLLEVSHVVDWSDAGGVTVLENGNIIGGSGVNFGCPV